MRLMSMSYQVGFIYGVELWTVQERVDLFAAIDINISDSFNPWVKLKPTNIRLD